MARAWLGHRIEAGYLAMRRGRRRRRPCVAKRRESQCQWHGAALARGEAYLLARARLGWALESVVAISQHVEGAPALERVRPDTDAVLVVSPN